MSVGISWVGDRGVRCNRRELLCSEVVSLVTVIWKDAQRHGSWGYVRTDFAVGKEYKLLLSEKQDSTVMEKKESCNKLLLCVSNMEENWIMKLHQAVLHFLTLILPSDLESAWNLKSLSQNGTTGEKKKQQKRKQMTRKKQILNNNLSSFSTPASTL